VALYASNTTNISSSFNGLYIGIYLVKRKKALALCSLRVGQLFGLWISYASRRRQILVGVYSPKKSASKPQGSRAAEEIHILADQNQKKDE
jgi:hypothetical protein